MKTRRVGTFTLGICLIAFGILFILKIYFSDITYQIISMFWPVIFILLGVEVIVSYFINNEEKIKYDVASFFLIILMTFFAFGMAAVDFVLNHQLELRNLIR